MDRRRFLHTGAAAVSASTLFSLRSTAAQASVKVTDPSPLPRRPYGTTGEYLSILTFPGLACRNMDPAVAKVLVRDAFEGTVNHFDVAPSYGNAEEILGPALEPYRNRVFLSCKSKQRTKDGILNELHESMKRLRTDYFDLYQMHCLITPEDVATAFGPNGAIETLVQAQKEGAIRYIGFSAHTVESAMAALRYYDFQSIMFPVNYVPWYAGNFGRQVVEYARERGAAVFGMKTMARQRLLKGEPRPVTNWYHPLAEEAEAALGLRFTLSQPVTTAVPPADEGLFRLALKLAPSVLPLSEAEHRMLQQKAQLSTPMFRYPAEEYDVRMMHGD